MRTIVEQSKYLAIVGVITALVSSLVAFGIAALKVYKLVAAIIQSIDEASSVIPLIEIMDVLLIATALLVFAIGLFDLFIAEIRAPDWLAIHDLHDLKTKLSSVAVLVMAITFLKNLEKWENAQETLLFAAAITLVAGMLIAFMRFSRHDH